jgi:putative oxidoreductase
VVLSPIMLKQLQNPLALAARILIALLFLPEGINKITGFSGTAAYIALAGLPLSELGVALAIVVEVGGSLALLIGYQARWAALVMAVFAVATGIFFHRFWTAPADQAMLEHIMFFKNMAIAGGLLMIVAFGAGAWSADARR